MNNKLKNNINKNYIFTFMQSLDLTRGMWMLYLASKGMSLTQLGLLETIFHITSFLCEVPTGAVADVYGRKISRAMGRIVYIISIFLLLIGNCFAMFALSFVLSAISYNLESGAGDALVYDSLTAIDEEGTFMMINGRKEVFYQCACVISFLAGGYIATKSYTFSFGITIVLGIITFLQSLSFTEPPIVKSNKDSVKQNFIYEFLTQLKSSFAILKNNKRVFYFIVHLELTMTFCTCAFFYLQNYLKGQGFNEFMIGIIYSASSLLPALCASQVHLLDKFAGEKFIIISVPFAAAICLLGISLSKFGYLFFIMLMVTESVVYVSLSDYINKLIPGEYRATILSFSSMIFSFFMIIMFPLSGFIGDRYSLSTSFMVLALVLGVFSTINCFIVLKNNNIPQK